MSLYKSFKHGDIVRTPLKRIARVTGFETDYHCRPPIKRVRLEYIAGDGVGPSDSVTLPEGVLRYAGIL